MPRDYAIVAKRFGVSLAAGDTVLVGLFAYLTCKSHKIIITGLHKKSIGESCAVSGAVLCIG